MRKVDPVKHEAKRREILNAAAVLFATRGFDGTTTAEICKAAGISAGNLFHYFGSKREIFAEVLQIGNDERTEQLAALRTSREPGRALLETVELLAAGAVEPLAPPLVMAAMMQAYYDPELAAMLSRDDDAERATIEMLLRRSAEAGEIDEALDIGDSASWIMALIGALYLRAATEEGFEAERQLKMLKLTVQRLLKLTV